MINSENYEISLVLSGGAGRGAFHLGVLEALQRENIQIKAISGTSIGGIIGSSFASGVSPQEQLEIFKSKAFRKAIKFSFKGGIFRIDHESDVINKLTTFENIEDLDIPLYLTVLELKSGQTMFLNKGNLKKGALATSALPFLFQPILIDDKHYVDGGLTNNLPVEPIKKYNLPTIASNLFPLPDDYKNRMFRSLKRSFFLMWQERNLKKSSSVDLFLTHKQLIKHNQFSFKYLDEGYKLGLEITLQELEAFKKNYKYLRESRVKESGKNVE